MSLNGSIIHFDTDHKAADEYTLQDFVKHQIKTIKNLVKYKEMLKRKLCGWFKTELIVISQLT